MEDLRVSESVCNIKEEKCDEIDFIDDKVNVLETAVTLEKVELPYYINDDQIKQDEASTILDDVKAEPSSSELQYNTISENVKTEAMDVDIKIEYANGLLYCEPCHSYYDDYCNKCGMLVYILNQIVLNNSDNIEQKDLPNDILEIQHSFGEIGIFTLKVIPEGVKFGPFIGLTKAECIWKIKGGKFVVDEDKPVYLNWMQYVNPAKNISEQNLLVFQYENNLYYKSTRQINEGEELLVYFGDEYEDSLNKSDEVTIIPTMEHLTQDVYACTFCCLGFSSEFYMEKHKTVCVKDSAGGFTTEELAQCPVCKIYLDQQEYSERHETYCRDRNAGNCIPSAPWTQTARVSGRKVCQRQIYKCEQCKYRTKYKGDLKHHTNQHYEVKTYKCGICSKRFNTTKCLTLHLENTRDCTDVKEVPDQSRNKAIKLEQSNSQGQMKRFKCSQCMFRTQYEQCLKNHIKTKHAKASNYICKTCDYKTHLKTIFQNYTKTKHLNQIKYKCDLCEYRTSGKFHLQCHINTIHLKEFAYRCDSCEFRTNMRYCLVKHIKTKHLNQFEHKCDSCDFRTSSKYDLEKHTKTKHLREFDYKCDSCKFGTNHRNDLTRHIKAKHLKEFDYKCDSCEFRTLRRNDLQKHMKTVHLKQFNYKCDSCEFVTNEKYHLEKHIKTKHLKEFNYKCESCEFETNSKAYLEKHIKTKHLLEFNNNCK